MNMLLEGEIGMNMHTNHLFFLLSGVEVICISFAWFSLLGQNFESIILTTFSSFLQYDSEIQYLESKGREQQDKLDALTQEINKTDQIYRQGSEQLQTLQYVEEEGELVRQQEKTLKSEITLLRSKLANCETELLQCKNKIRLLMDEIQVEQRKYCRQYDTNRAQLERHLMSEVDRIQLEIDLAIQSTDHASKATDKLKSEVAGIESNIAEKKKQVEQLVHEMKEVNLQSLAVAPADEVRHLLEGEFRGSWGFFNRKS